MKTPFAVCAAILIMTADALGAAPSALVCQFTPRHTANLDPSYRATSSSERLSFTFAAINRTALTAQMVGNAGAANVHLVEGRGVLHFLELTDTGNLTTTSVFESEAKPGAPIPAVHSRHMTLFGNMPIVSQYTGSCDPKF